MKELKAIKREISLLKKLHHPNIVKYYGAELTEEGEGFDIVLEYVAGGSVKQLIEKFGPLEEETVRHYTRELLKGLGHLHRQSIIHRDLKCANILIDSAGTVKLTDFGTARHINAHSTQGEETHLSIIGSPYWMAPEVIKKEHYDLSADIWGLGCCVVEMLQGKHPWIELGKQGLDVME